LGQLVEESKPGIEKARELRFSQKANGVSRLEEETSPSIWEKKEEKGPQPPVNLKLTPACAVLIKELYLARKKKDEKGMSRNIIETCHDRFPKLRYWEKGGTTSRDQREKL